MAAQEINTAETTSVTKGASLSGSKAGPLSPEERAQMIAEAAYYRAEKRGFAAGGELQDWLEAEKEVAALESGPTGRTPVMTSSSRIVEKTANVVAAAAAKATEQKTQYRI